MNTLGASTSKQPSLDPNSPISVVIPTYNRAKTLPRALDSIFKQIHSPREIIIIDDGSTDDTFAVVKNYFELGVIYKHLEKNRGASAARNVGITCATGEFIAFLDSDDEWSPNKLACQLQTIKSSDQCVLVFTSVIIREPGKADRVRIVTAGYYDTTSLYNTYSTIGGTSAAMARRHAILDAGCFNETLPALEDWDLWFKLNTLGKIGCTSKAFTIVNGDTHNRITKNHVSLSSGYRYIFRTYVRPFERGNGVRMNEFYIHFGDILLATGRRKAAQVAFIYSFSRKKRLRSAISLLLTLLPIDITIYNAIISSFFYLKNLNSVLAHKLIYILQKLAKHEQ